MYLKAYITCFYGDKALLVTQLYRVQHGVLCRLLVYETGVTVDCVTLDSAG